MLISFASTDWGAGILMISSAWLLDLLFGDPQCLPHPIVWMGKWISFWEHRLNKGRWRMTKGAIFAMCSVAMVFTLVWAFFLITPEVWHIPMGAVIGFYSLAGRTLRREVIKVFEALEHGVDEGRRQVARIVGRDTERLSPHEVRAAALETLAENLSDGVVAPLFWFALLGPAGMLTYKMINTLDSMIGYHSERYLRFGAFAARMDDVANFLPARLTALLMLLVSGRLGIFRPLTHKAGLFRFVLHHGPKHASPNSGWPEAALAGILNCRFGGTHNYFGQEFYKPYIGHNPRELTDRDLHRSISVCFHAEILTVFLTIGVCLWLW